MIISKRNSTCCFLAITRYRSLFDTGRCCARWLLVVAVQLLRVTPLHHQLRFRVSHTLASRIRGTDKGDR